MGSLNLWRPDLCGGELWLTVTAVKGSNTAFTRVHLNTDLHYGTQTVKIQYGINSTIINTAITQTEEP